MVALFVPSGSVFIGRSLLVGAMLLFNCELIRPALGPDLLGFAVNVFDFGLLSFGEALSISPYLTPVLTLHGFLPVLTGVGAFFDLVKWSPTGRSEAVVGGTL